MTVEDLLQELLENQKVMYGTLQRIVEQLSFGEPTLETKTYETTELTEAIPPSEPTFFKPGSFIPEIKAVVLDEPTFNEGTRRDRSEWRYAKFRVKVGDTVARLTLWDSSASEVMGLQKGEVIRLTSISVKDPYQGTPQISSTRKTEFGIIDI